MRLAEGPRPEVGDIDAARQRVHLTHRIEARFDLLEVWKIPGRHSIRTSARYTHLTAGMRQNVRQVIHALMKCVFRATVTTDSA